ncbi:MAG: hypothetical protein AAGB93_00210 [Planctomycetota bacterium]
MAQGDCMKVGEKEFCYSRAAPCPCSKAQNYASHNADKVESWGKYLQKQAPKVKGTQIVARIQAVARSAEHHHIVCVSAACKFLAFPRAHAFASSTTWCINDSANMIALPMWAMHLMQYCDLLSANPRVKSTETAYGDLPTFVDTNVTPPPFYNLPMHDQDHDLYLKEVDEDMEDIARDLPQVGACQDPEKTLKDELNGVIETYSLQLMENGCSHGGTHRSWVKGIRDPNSDWYKPFSMCRTPRTRVHPMAGSGPYFQKMQDLHTAFWLEGNPVVFV